MQNVFTEQSSQNLATNVHCRLVQAIEKFAENIPLPADKTTQTFSKKNLAIGVTQVTEKEQKDLETNGFIISGNVDGEKTSVEMEKLSDAKGSSFSRVADIKLPGELFKVASKKKGMTKGGLRVTTLLYDNAKLFRSKETSGSSPSKKINSKILAVGIKGIKLKNLTEQERVRSEFKQLNMSEEGKPICVYWEEIQRGIHHFSFRVLFFSLHFTRSLLAVSLFQLVFSSLDRCLSCIGRHHSSEVRFLLIDSVVIGSNPPSAKLSLGQRSFASSLYLLV